MRRIKLVASDFHVGTGRRNPDGSLNLLEDFIFEERFIEFLEHYSTGDYTTAEVELILNGDFFNLIQVELDGDVPSDISENDAVRQMQLVLDNHPLLFDALRGFAESPGKSLTFNVGNHDAQVWWPEVKRLLRERIGHAVSINNRSYEFDGIHIEHGDKYEPVHAVDPKLPFLSKGLKTPILNIPWATYFFIHFVRKLKRKRSYIDKVKPFRNYLTWSAIWDFRFFVGTMTRLVLFTLYSAFFGKVGNRRFGLGLFGTLIRQIDPNPEENAARKLLMTRSDLRVAIFGHTHSPIYRQYPGGKEYFNAGTWNGVTNLDIEGFGYQVRCTYALLEWQDGRWLTSLRVWRGSAQVSETYWG
jgi:UDP-2,3-diacylglucosamine pyrophosphatase LpxH